MKGWTPDAVKTASPTSRSMSASFLTASLTCRGVILILWSGSSDEVCSGYEYEGKTDCLARLDRSVRASPPRGIRAHRLKTSASSPMIDVIQR